MKQRKQLLNSLGLSSPHLSQHLLRLLLLLVTAIGGVGSSWAQEVTITNGSFENNNFDGWSNTGEFELKNTTVFTVKDGTYFAEIYNKAEGTVLDLNQTVENLTVGVYKITAKVKARDIANAVLYANDKETAIVDNADSKEYAVYVYLKEAGSIKFGVKGTSTGKSANWFACDDFQVTKINTSATTADLVQMQTGDVFIPSYTIYKNTLSADGKLLAMSGDCDYNSGYGMRIKDNRYLAFKVPAGASIRVKVYNNSGSEKRTVQLGTETGGHSKNLSSLEINPRTTDVLTTTYSTGGVVYLSASGDMYIKELAIVNLYSITFHHNGHAKEDDYVLPGQSAIPSPIPAPDVAADGYTLVGWYTDQALTIPATPGADLTGNIDLYAKWMINKGFPVSFDANGIYTATDKLVEPQRGLGVTLPTAYDEILQVVEPGTWKNQVGTNTQPYGPFQEAYKGGSVGEGKVLYQELTGLTNGKYEVVLDVAASATNIRLENGQQLNCPTGNELTQAFAGNAVKNIPVLNRTAFDTETDYDRVVLVANVTDGTLSYGIQNVAESGNWYACRVQSIKRIDDTFFAGWNTKKDGTGTTYAAGTSYSPDNDGVTLYAQYTKAYKFRPVAKTGGTIYSVTVNGNAVSFANNQDIKVAENAKVVMTVSLQSGYKFKNWSNNGTVGEESNDGLTYTISQIKANTTLTANFTALNDATDPNPVNGSLSGTVVTINPFPAANAGQSQTINLGLPTGATAVVKTDETGLNASIADGILTINAPATGNNASITITVTAENGKTKDYTITVSTVEGASFNYTVNLVNGSTVLETIASGDYVEGTSNITVYYPQHILKGTTLYELTADAGEYKYRKSFAPNANDYKVNIDKKAEVENVVYFTEAENLPGYAATTGNTKYASNGVAARNNANDCYTTTLNRGKYKFVVRGFGGAENKKVTIKVNGEIVFEQSFTSSFGVDANKDIYVTEDNSDVTVATAGDSSSGLDWFYIQDLGVLPVTEDGQVEYLTKANNDAYSYFTSNPGTDEASGWTQITKDGVAGEFMSFNHNGTPYVQLNTNGAVAFEVFTEANGDNKKYNIQVGTASAQEYIANKALQSSGIIVTGSSSNDVKIKIYKKDKSTIYPVKVKFYTKPLIVGNTSATILMGKENQTIENIECVGGTLILNAISSQASEFIDAASFSAGTLTITPKKAGIANLTFNIVDAESNVLNTVDYVVNVVKQKVNLTYLANTKDNYNATTDGEFTSPTAVVKTVDGSTDVTSEVTLLYISDDESLVRYSGAEAKLVPNMQGVAKLKAVLYNDPVYEADDAIAIFTVNVTDGIQKHLSSSIPAINSTLVAKDGDNVLMTMTYGGYKYQNGKYTHESKGVVTDSWKGDKGTDSSTSSYGGQGTDIFGNTFDNEIDGFGLQAQAQYDSRDEYNRGIQWFTTNDVKTDGSTHYTKNERIKPFSLPVKGAYLKFEAEVNGTLTAYVLQNGNINFSSEAGHRDEPQKAEGDKKAIGTTPRVYYWFNQDGYRIDPISYTSKQPLTIGRDYNDDIKNELNGWYGSNAGLKEMLENGGWPTQAEVNANRQKPVPTPQPVVRYNDGYMVAQKAYVKYVIPVVAGDTYYFFSNGSKVGAAGFNFQPAEDGTVDLILPEDGGARTMEAHTNEGPKALNCAEDEATTHKTTNSIEMYKEVTLPRKFKAETWSTICLPFHVTETQVERVFGKGTNLVIYNGVQGNDARFQKHVNQDILAGQPYLIYPTGKDAEGNTLSTVSGDYIGGATTSITFTNVNFTPNVAVQSYASDKDGAEGADGYGTQNPSYNFIGTLAPVTVNKYDYYVNNNTGAVTRYMSDNQLTLKAYYAYLKNAAKDPSSASAKVISGIFIDNVEGDGLDNPTAIMNALVEMGADVRPVDGIFNLSGQKVAESTKNLSKGIYIINGQKVIIK